MKYRRLDPAGDCTLGHNAADYLIDSPECVAQAVVTRLRLLAGEWFLDLTEGVPYQGRVLGKHTPGSYNPLIRARILGTEGVTEITFYEAIYNSETRHLTVNATIATVYGNATIKEML